MSPGLLTAQRTESAHDAATAAVHDAFISYSRADRAFAAALAARLERYRPPRDLNVPYRHLRIFRDEQDFTGTEYKSALERHLLASRKLIVICSPAARASIYVAEEIRLFAAAKGAEHIIPVLLHGIPNNEFAGSDDSQLAFPDALCAVMTMPLAASYRGWTGGKSAIDRGAYQDAWLTLLSNLYDIARSDLEQRERRRQAATRRRWASATAAIVMALSALTVWALLSRREAVNQRHSAERAAAAELVAKNAAVKSAEEERKAKDVAEQKRLEAERQRQIAITRQLASLSELTINQEPNQLTTSVLLAVESLHPARQSASLEGYQALRHGLSLLPPRPTVLPHNGQLISSSVSADGGFLVTLSSNGQNKTATLWSIRNRSPRVLRRLTSSIIRAVRTVSVSPGGRYVALLRPGDALIWDAQSSSGPVALSPGIREPIAAGFSLDGQHIAVVGYLGAMFRVWSVNGWQVQNQQVSGQFMTIGFTARGTVMTAGGGGLAEWAVPEGKPLRRCSTAVPGMASFSGDASAAALVASDGTVRVVRFGGEKDSSCFEVARIRHQEAVTDIAVTSAGNHVAIASQDGTARVWATADSREMERMTHAASVATVDFDTDGHRLFTGGRGATVLQWDVSDSAGTRSFVHTADVIGTAFARDASSVASVTSNGGVLLWSLAPARGLRMPPHELHAAFVQLNDMRGGFDPVPRVVTHAFSPNGRFVGLLTTESLLTWEIASKRQLPEITENIEEVDRLALSDDGRFVAVWPNHGPVNLLLTGEQGSQAARRLTATAIDAAFVGSRVRLATIDGGNAVTLWEPATGRRDGLLQHDQPIASLISNGRYLATTTNGGVATVWDSQTKLPAGRLTLEEGSALHAVSRDAAYGATIRGSAASVWEVRTGTEIARLVHAGAIRELTFSADGRLLATASADLTARVWQWRPDDLVSEACARLTRKALAPDDWRRFLAPEPPRNSCQPPTTAMPQKTAAR